jgi:poly-gamma-glutamate capsule biosynthesis protein CapA/YwtB (metallophosphatase superfamily)
MSAAAELRSTEPPAQQTIRLFLCGDVMLGRGIDQVLPRPCSPILHESYVHSALDYMRLAEEANGPISRPVTPSYVWGAALDELNRCQPDARIINLETAITRSQDFAPKGINYRMSPENADCLTAAAIDCCVLANNHVLDWGRKGLFDTLTALERLQIKSAGAGRDLDEASAPAALQFAGKGRVLVFSFAVVTSGAPRSWAATLDAPGVNLLTDLSEATAVRISEQIARQRQPHDVIVVSMHWGPNWGYDIPEEQRRLAHALIERADVSVIHGHSSHHAKGIEVYRNRLILYGCGDFLNDYEGIQGYEDYRGDLALMYFADIEPASSDLAAVEIVPLQIRKFSLVRPSAPDIDWVRQTLDRESRRFGTSVAMISPGRLVLSWPSRSATPGDIERT